MNYRTTMNGDFPCAVELPERVQTFVGLAPVIKNYCDIVVHDFLLIVGFL
jgi:hypothetical protein